MKSFPGLFILLAVSLLSQLCLADVGINQAECVMSIGPVECESYSGDFEGGEPSSAACSSMVVFKSRAGEYGSKNYSGTFYLREGFFSESKAASGARAQVRRQMAIVLVLPKCK